VRRRGPQRHGRLPRQGRLRHVQPHQVGAPPAHPRRPEGRVPAVPRAGAEGDAADHPLAVALMDVGVFVPLGSGNLEPDLVRAVGVEAEARGFESIWLPEHVVQFDGYESSYPYAADGRMPGGPEFGMAEPFTALTFLAAVTERIRLGTGI